MTWDWGDGSAPTVSDPIPDPCGGPVTASHYYNIDHEEQVTLTQSLNDPDASVPASTIVILFSAGEPSAAAPAPEASVPPDGPCDSLATCPQLVRYSSATPSSLLELCQDLGHQFDDFVTVESLAQQSLPPLRIQEQNLINAIGNQALYNPTAPPDQTLMNQLAQVRGKIGGFEAILAAIEQSRPQVLDQYTSNGCETVLYGHTT